MSPRTQRTIYRFVAVFLAAGAGDAIIQFASDGQYNWRHLVAMLVPAAVIAVDTFLKNTGDNAVPTIAAVNTAIQNNAATVPPPSVAVPEAHILTQPVPPVP